MKYFAYGCNMNPEKMEDRNITFSHRTLAILKGYNLKFNKVASSNPKEGYANIVPYEKGIVEGALYDIQDSALSNLDRYEGYPNHYDKIRVKVLLDIGQEVEAITYIAKPDKIKEGLKPKKDYLKHLLSACDILSEPYCKRLKSYDTLD